MKLGDLFNIVRRTTAQPEQEVQSRQTPSGFKRTNFAPIPDLRANHIKLPSSTRACNDLLRGGFDHDRTAINSALKRQALINARDGDENNVLHKIASAGVADHPSKAPTQAQVDCLQLVLCKTDLHGKRIDLSARNDDGQTPLHIAAQTGQTHFFKALLGVVLSEDHKPEDPASPKLDLTALTVSDASGRSVFDLAASASIREHLGKLFEIHLLRQPE